LADAKRVEPTEVPRLAPAALTLALVAALAAAAVAAPASGAATGIRYGLTDDAWIANGPGTLDARLTRLNSLGVRVVRFSLRWNLIARTRPTTATDPSDPAYDWSATDTVLDGLRQHGIDVVLQLVGTPTWANGGKPANYAPASASSFGAFASAAADHYPWVRRWLIWNEPNQRIWLRPTTPSIYTTRLLNPAYRAIHAAIAGAQVAGGGTAPRGATGGVSPVAWLTGLHAAHALLDAYAHNPYPLDPKRESPVRGGCANCTTITMATLDKLVRLVAQDFPRARIWLTEYGYQTNPPDRLLGVAPSLQARYLAEGDYVAFRTPRVDLLFQFLYRDEPNLARFQSGLVTLGNRPKPAYAAFELPLAEVSRSGSRVALWGQLRAPAAGRTARIEQRIGATWRTLATLHAGSGGFFRATVNAQRGTQLRLRAGTLVGAPLPVT
jgi:hypothetical protein